jgi:hypothetical protein
MFIRRAVAGLDVRYLEPWYCGAVTDWELQRQCRLRRRIWSHRPGFGRSANLLLTIGFLPAATVG